MREAEEGHEIVIARRSQPVAVLIGMDRLTRLQELEADLRDLALVTARVAGDNGRRIPFEEVISLLGVTRAEIDAEADSD